MARPRAGGTLRVRHGGCRGATADPGGTRTAQIVPADTYARLQRIRCLQWARAPGRLVRRTRTRLRQPFHPLVGDQEGRRHEKDSYGYVPAAQQVVWDSNPETGFSVHGLD